MLNGSDFVMLKRKWFFVVLLGSILLSSLVFFGYEKSDKSPWKKADVPYTTDCNKCPIVESVIPGHHGSAMPLVFNPDVDDATAQWSDCIESVMRCMREKKSFTSCVTETSSCPKVCVTSFQKQVAKVKTYKEQRRVFESIFINDGGMCVPDARQVVK
jgi:hypothetical protein